MNRVRTLAGVLTTLVLVVVPAQAWWSDGHVHITEGAVSHLPQPLKTFFLANVDNVASYSGQEPTGAKHYIDIDYYPEFFAGTFPHDIDDLIAIYGTAVVEDNGTAPWAVGDYAQALSAEMAAATTAQDWADLLHTAGALAHYVEDLHNPLHLTLNYNGQLTGNDGIHARYEGEMISRHLADLVITTTPANCVYQPSPVDAIFDGIDIHYWFVDDILDADTANRGSPPDYDEAYYAGMWTDTGTLTLSVFQDASEAVASVWYTAWVDAGSPVPVFASGSGDHDHDGAVDLEDFAAFQLCYTGEGMGPSAGGCEVFCFDGDDDVDLADYAGFLAVFTGPSPNAGTCRTIAQARASGAGVEVSICNAVVTTTTDLIGSTSYKDFHIQDATGGLKVFGSNSAINTLLAQLDEGDSIDLRGTTDIYRGMFELVAEFELLDTHGTPGVPAPTTTSAGDFADGSPTAEALEGMLVVLPCATFQASGTFERNDYTVTTAAGSITVAIRTNELTLVGQAIPFGPVDVVGIFAQEDSYAPFDGGYELWVRSIADLQTPATCAK